MSYQPMDPMKRELINIGLHPRQMDITGHRYNRFEVISYAGRDTTSGHHYWNCRCDCGTERQLFVGAVRSGSYKSCGCGRSEVTSQRSFVHGQAGRKRFTPEYNSWRGMIDRCYSEDHISYPYYGGRGIAVCDQWRESAESFLTYMGPKPSRGHSIDRFPNSDGNYEPGNCRWATQKEQMATARKPVRRDEPCRLTVFKRKKKAIKDQAVIVA